MLVISALLGLLISMDVYFIVNLLIFMVKDIMWRCGKRVITIKSIFDYV